MRIRGGKLVPPELLYQSGWKDDTRLWLDLGEYHTKSIYTVYLPLEFKEFQTNTRSSVVILKLKLIYIRIRITRGNATRLVPVLGVSEEEVPK